MKSIQTSRSSDNSSASHVGLGPRDSFFSSSSSHRISSRTKATHDVRKTAHHEPVLNTMSQKNSSSRTNATHDVTEKQLITNQCYTRCHRKTAQWHFEPSHFITNQGLRSFSKSDKSLDWSRSIYSCQTRSIQSGEKEHAESQIFLVAVGVVILSSAKSAADYALFYK